MRRSRPIPQSELRQSRKRPLARAAGVVLLLLSVAAILWFGKYWFFDKPLSAGGLDLAQFSESQLAEHLDADELAGTSKFLTDVEAFRQTLHRPASSFLQGRQPYVFKSIGLLGWMLVSLTVLSGVTGVGMKLVVKTRRMQRD